jgi:hypothetical protein
MGQIIDTTVDGAKKVGNDVVAIATQPIGPFTWIDRGVSDVRRTIRSVARSARDKVRGGGKRRF